MKQIKILCDFCKKENTVEVALYTGRAVDAAGSSETTFDVYDLCINCLKQKFLFMVRNADKALGPLVIDNFRKTKLKNEN